MIVKRRQPPGWLLWGALFAAAYAQSPLYTSNQNQYFLHGLARAGRGLLAADWLANTPDPAPLFSLLVELISRLARLDAAFYLLYAALMVAYLVSFGRIAAAVFPLETPARRAFFYAGWILLHSAGLRFALSRLLGDNWTYVLEDGVADQRMLGLVFQPSAFGVFLALAVPLALSGRRIAAAVSAALAASFHPTYLLPAALVTLAVMWDGWRQEGGWRAWLLPGLAALAGVAPILAYTVFNFVAPANPALAAEARRILVEFRIPHHALIAEWFDATAVFKIALILSAGWLARRTRLAAFLWIPFTGALALTLIQALTGSHFLALIFPWRVSTLLVPLAAAAWLGWAARLATQPSKVSLPARGERLVQGSALALALLAAAAGLLRFGLDLGRKAALPENGLYTHVRQTLQPGEVYLIPVKMQDFRLAAGAPAYVDFKAIPYAETDVLEWYRRERLADEFYLQTGCDRLEAFAVQEGVTHAVLPAGSPAEGCFSPGSAAYRDPFYSLYRLRR
jgi:hypothetical protein